MAIYRNVHLSFWNDAKVTDDFTPEDKYFYLYLLTNPHTNLSGCYEISLKQMSLEMGYTKESIEGLIKRFSEVYKVIMYDKNSKEMLLMNWSKYNWTKSPKFIAALKKEILSVKTDKFKEFLANKLYTKDTNCTNEKYGIDTVSSSERYGIDTTVTVSDTVTDNITSNITKSNNLKLSDTSTKSSEHKDVVDKTKTGSKCERFSDFWKSYPKHNRQHEAERAYCDAVLHGVPEDDLVQAAKGYEKACKDKGTEERYIMLAHNFINNMTFKDYLRAETEQEPKKEPAKKEEYIPPAERIPKELAEKFRARGLVYDDGQMDYFEMTEEERNEIRKYGCL